MTLFDHEKEVFKFTHRPIRLFESFSGIGCQAMALKRLGVEIEHVGISEIDKYALASYKAIHGDVKNYGDIMKIDGSTLPEIDLFTWSFPCTDLSKAGKQKGLDGGTRSGLGYEVIRIISEMAVKPKVLLMENVPDLLSPQNKRGWRQMYLDIENMGYTNYVETLNAKNYGVAQNRDRVFMVSILGDYSYTFPGWIKLEKRLKDYLEENVDEKYYLSEKQLKTIYPTSHEDGILHEHEFTHHIDNKIQVSYALSSREHKANGWLDIFPTLCARDFKDPKIIKEDEVMDYRYDDGVRSRVEKNILPTTTTKIGSKGISGQTLIKQGIKIPEATKQGYALAKDGDGVYINRPHQKRGVVQDDMIQTIKTTSDDVGVVVEEKHIIDLKSSDKFRRQPSNEIMPAILTDSRFSILESVNKTWRFKNIEIIYQKEISLDSNGSAIYDYYLTNQYLCVDYDNKTYIYNADDNLLYRIRRLTSFETWLGMSISDEDYYKASKVCSNSQLYKQAGNGIVVNVLEAIFRRLI